MIDEFPVYVDKDGNRALYSESWVFQDPATGNFMQSSGARSNLYPLTGEDWSHFEVLTSAFIDYNAVPIQYPH